MNTDVVVIGAGIVGASCAWHLARRGLDVVVLEREDGPAMGSTGRSAAGVRVQFTTAANVGLSMYSLPVYRTFEEQHGYSVGYRAIGYLLLVPHARWSAHLESVALQRSLGAPVDVLGPQDALRYAPFDVEGLAGATFGPWDGVIDPHMATHAWIVMSRELGVRYRFSRPVQELEPSGGGWRVRAGSETLSCAHVVNAAGAWSAEVAALAGLDLPVGPKRIQIFVSGPVADTRTYPLTIDVESGVYLRSEGNRVLFGLDDLGQELGFTEGVEPAWLEHVLVSGVGRFPWWEDLGVDLKRSWWGYYAVSPDNSPIIGPNPGADAWIDACGFSGHGIMHAPATGRAVSELVADGHATTVDVAAFAHERFQEPAPASAVETNVF